MRIGVSISCYRLVSFPSGDIRKVSFDPGQETTHMKNPYSVKAVLTGEESHRETELVTQLAFWLLVNVR